MLELRNKNTFAQWHKAYRTSQQVCRPYQQPETVLISEEGYLFFVQAANGLKKLVVREGPCLLIEIGKASGQEILAKLAPTIVFRARNDLQFTELILQFLVSL